MDKLQHFPSGSDQWIDDPSHAKIGIHPYPDKLYVITMLENPLRWRSRYANYATFRHHVEQAGAILYTGEVALGGRKFEVTEPGNPQHLQLRAHSELWRKENVLNLIVNRLPADAKYIAWVDADISFARPDWAQEALHLLQHYDVIQMFGEVLNLGPSFETLTGRRSFTWNWCENRESPSHADFSRPRMIDIPANGSYYGQKKTWNHTGFAWAWRKAAYDAVGGLMDHAILGSGDYHVASALVGHVEWSLNDQFPRRYSDLCYQWQDRAAIIRNNPNGGLGYMPGAILHHFHGTTKNRSYKDRWKLLARTGFNPDLDIKRDFQGLWQLTDRCPELRDGIRAYNRIRDEDSPVVEGML